LLTHWVTTWLRVICLAAKAGVTASRVNPEMAAARVNLAIMFVSRAEEEDRTACLLQRPMIAQS